MKRLGLLLAFIMMAVTSSAVLAADPVHYLNGQTRVPVSTSSPLPVVEFPQKAPSPTPSPICQTITADTTVLAANSSRVKWMVWNTGGTAGISYFNLGATATIPPATGTTATSYPIQSGQSYEDVGAGVYKGDIHVIPKDGSEWFCAEQRIQ